MGARGPKPKVKPDNMMQLKRGIPQPPQWLTVRAKAEYRRVANLLSEAEVCSLADRAHLTSYAQAWGEFEELSIKLQKSSMMTMTDRGNPVLDPLCKARQDAHLRMTKSAEKLGLSPADRERLKMPASAKEEKADPLEAYLRGNG
jgi:P27 family predicted phage terminase small subunit